MAQNITLLGASYTAVPAVTLPKTGGGTAKFSDASVTTAVASDVAEGKIFLLADGTQATGTGEGGGSVTWETIANQDVTIASSNPNYFVINNYTTPFSEDETYRVTWGSGGTEYICQTLEAASAQVYDGWYIGNLGIAGGADTGEPFLIYRDSATRLVCATNQSAGSFHVKIERQTTSSATLITKTITANGTYSAEDDDADGYSSVTVNVPSSAASSWTKVAETSYQVSTTSTTAATVDTWATGHSEILTSDKIVYVRIRDTAGKRAGYFYGIDAWVMNRYPKTPSLSSYTSSSELVYQIWRVNSAGEYACRYGYNTTGYGVFPDTIYNNGAIRIRSRYNSSYSLTINGTYKVEVYLLDPPTGAPIFT